MTDVTPAAESPPVTLDVDGRRVEVPGDMTLLDALRDVLGERAAKDGCSPQGQCGCCTVLVDGAPRVACVTPVRRVRGRAITTPDHVEEAQRWAEAFCATGASQCGFCTPGIVARLAGLRAKNPDAGHDAVEQALLAHLCRCTGWRTILDAWDLFAEMGPIDPAADRDLELAARRAALEGGWPQRVDPDVALGRAGFADDTAPIESLVALLDSENRWTLGESVAAARQAAVAVQGRRTTADAVPPIEVPDGDWDLILQTSWVDPGYLETDSSWAAPGSEPADPLANGGAFGGKADTDVGDAARRLADEHGQPVRARYRREDTVRLGPKRPPLAAGLRADGTGVVRVARTAGVADVIASELPGVEVEEVDVPGPPTSLDLRGAGWLEAAVLAESLAHVARSDASGDEPTAVTIGPVRQPEGGTATATVDADGTVHVTVDAGDPLDEVVLRSYCVGAAHQGLSLVTSESLAVDPDGVVHDLTIRSFGILRAVDTPPIEIDITPSSATPVPVSQAVAAAVATAIWCAQGRPPVWPTRVLPRRPDGKMAP